MSTAAKSARLSLRELRRLQWLLGCLLVYLSAGTLLFLEMEEWFLFFALLLGASFALWRPGWLHRSPPWVHRAAFPLVLAVFVGDLWLTGQPLPSLIRLSLWLLLYRCLSPRGRREELQLVLLGLFLLVVAGVLTVSLAFALQLLLFTACALVLLLVLTLADSLAAGQAAAPGDLWEEPHSWSGLLRRVLSILDWRLTALGLGLFAGLVCTAALLFVSIPRFQFENSLFLERFISKKARTGFSESVRFGEVSEIVQDNTLALTVDPSDPGLLPATPYFRMLVLDEYMPEGGFRVSAQSRRDLAATERQGTYLRGTYLMRGDRTGTWTFYLEAGTSRFLPLCGPFVELRLREPHPVQFNLRQQIVALKSEPAAMTAYRVEQPQAGTRLPDRDFGLRLTAARQNPGVAARLEGRLLLELPRDPEARQVLAETCRAAGLRPGLGAQELSALLGKYLALHHSYSLSPGRITGKGDPLVLWLRSKQPGHCELFAGSFVLLARSAGFPARLLVGFKGGVWNAFSNSLSVRNSDAHAWCEIWDGEAWLRVDPTPGANLLGEREALADIRERRMDSSWNARLNSLRVFWYRRIVNFDQRTQLEAVDSLRAGAESGRRFTVAFIEEKLRRLKALLSFKLSKSQLRWSLLGVAGSAVGLWLGLRFLRSWRWRLGRGKVGAQNPVRREAGRWLRRLAREENVEKTLLSQLQSLRYGPEAGWPDPAQVFRRARRKPR